MKKLICLLLSICLLASLTACGGSQPQEDTIPQETTLETTQQTTQESTEPAATPSSPVLYKVTDQEGHVIYLFGSIHVANDEMYPLPDYVMNAFNSCDSMAAEFDAVTATNDIQGMTAALRSMVLTDGTRITDHISEETYNKAVQILDQNGIYSGVYDMYTPILWYSLISSYAVMNYGLDPDNGIDMHLLTLAHKEGKPVHEVESMKSQYDLLANMSMDLQVYLLESAIAEYDDPQVQAETLELCHLWATGNEAKIIELLNADNAQMSSEEAVLFSEFNKVMLTDRNQAMTQFALEALEAGETMFICVGAAHILGPGAMVDLLTQSGCTAERIYA